jgi:hypothetical protein
MTENVLTSRQRKALAALLTNKTVSAAAEACGLAEKTLHRFLAIPAFRAALTQAETLTIDEAGRRLLSGQTQALDTLEGLINGALKESDQRLAAVAWMDLVLRWHELRNMEERLSALEEAVRDVKHK